MELVVSKVLGLELGSVELGSVRIGLEVRVTGLELGFRISLLFARFCQVVRSM